MGFTHCGGETQVRPALPNKAVIIDSHPLPHIEEMFHELRGAQMFSSIDLQNADYQVPLHPESRDLTSFITHSGLFHFSECISAHDVTNPVGLDGVQCYLNDIVAFADTPSLH